MRRFANFYIVLFLIDAGLSLVDELLLFYGSSASAFTSLRMLIALSVMFLSVIFYACLGIDRRLPKRVFLPLTLYSFWCSVGMWPFSAVVGHDSIGVAASIGQVIVGGFAIVLLVGLCGRPLLTELHFRREMFSLRNTLGFTGINLLLTPVFLIYTGLALTGYYLEQQTAGFLRLSPVGIYMSERSYHRGNKVVRLAGMMHVGKEDYYEALADSIPSESTIILAEGVTDKDGLLEYQFNYSKVARAIGLTSQDKMNIDANLVDLNALDGSVEDALPQDKPDIARADIDLNRFDAFTVEFLNVLGKTLLSDKPFIEAFAEYNVWVEANMTPEKMSAVMNDIINKRNKVVIDSVARTLSHYDTIIVPWGAMHMPEIETAVLGKGFRAGERRERLSLDFRTIPYAQLLQQLKQSTSQSKQSSTPVGPGDS